MLYSVVNKQATNALPLPLTVACGQIVVGAIWAALLWASRVRAPPRLSAAAFWTLLPIGTLHGIGHVTGVLGTATGSVSFVQVVKSAGPVYACALSGLLLRTRTSLRVWLSLAPVVGGVALASAKELAFVWTAFLGAAASDVALALRNILTKMSMDRPQGENMNPTNTYYTLTILACLFCVPAALLLEGAAMPAAWAAATPDLRAALNVVWLTVSSGLYFTAYTEVAMNALDSISPTTWAVGNTMRRVVIMVVSMVVFRTPMTPLGAAGSALAITGAFSYAMIRHAEKMAEKAQAEQPVHEQHPQLVTEAVPSRGGLLGGGVHGYDQVAKHDLVVERK